MFGEVFTAGAVSVADAGADDDSDFVLAIIVAVPRVGKQACISRAMRSNTSLTP